jgi:hypothetical protein
MSETNEARIGDIVQCVSGPNRVCIGIVMEMSPSHYKVFVRMPIDSGSARSIHFRVRADECVIIGRAKLRPLLPGEAPRKQAPPPPNQEQPAPKAQPIKAQPVLPTRSATVAPSVAPPVESAAQAGADLQAEADIDPSALQTMVFKRASAWDAHHLPPPGQPTVVEDVAVPNPAPHPVEVADPMLPQEPKTRGRRRRSRMPTKKYSDA